jgi:Glycerophosphoryl diester phosphodiesterase family
VLGATARRWVIVLVVVVALVLVVVIGWPSFQSYTGAARPAQFYRHVQLDPTLTARYPLVLGVAHNAGNNAHTAATALRYGADVIEIDVIAARGRLVAGREQTWPWLAERLFRGPTLQQAWQDAAGARIVKLDLKQSGRGFLDDVAAFLEASAGARQVMVSSPDAQALTYLHSRLPGVGLLLSVNGPDPLHRLYTDAALQQVISGTSVFAGLVDAHLVAWAHQRKLQVLAWTVNAGPELNRLVGLGVDGITTANLAILQALR